MNARRNWVIEIARLRGWATILERVAGELTRLASQMRARADGLERKGPAEVQP